MENGQAEQGQGNLMEIYQGHREEINMCGSLGKFKAIQPGFEITEAYK
jgi:hypothetical protein